MTTDTEHTARLEAHALVVEQNGRGMVYESLIHAIEVLRGNEIREAKARCWDALEAQTKVRNERQQAMFRGAPYDKSATQRASWERIESLAALHELESK